MKKLVDLILEVLKEIDVRDAYGHLVSTDIPKLKLNRYSLPDEEIVFIVNPFISFVKHKYGSKYETYLEKMLELISKLKKNNESIDRIAGTVNKKFDSGFSASQIKKLLEVFKQADDLRGTENLINYYNQVVKRKDLELPIYKPSKDKPREPTPVLREKKVKVKYKCN